MGVEDKQEEAKAAEGPPKQEEKPAGEPKEEKKDDSKPSPPPPIVIYVDLHCVGCAKKIERSILKCRGVEEVKTNIEKNEVTVKGAVDPHTLCSRIQKKTSRNAKLLSPLDAAVSNKSESNPPQESGIATVELQVNMHCEACAQQLRKKILKMRGVQAAETDLNAKKVTVTGTMNGDKLVEHIHRRTGKIARIIPPPPPPEEKKEAADEEKKAENDQNPSEEKKDDGKGAEEKKEGDDSKPAEGNKEEKTAGEGVDEKSKMEEAAAEQAMVSANADEMAKRMIYWNGAGGYMMNHEDEMAKRMMMMHHWMPMPMPMLMPTPAMYVFGQPQFLHPPPPPPQIFSDENPNACCIS